MVLDASSEQRIDLNPTSTEGSCCSPNEIKLEVGVPVCVSPDSQASAKGDSQSDSDPDQNDCGTPLYKTYNGTCGEMQPQQAQQAHHMKLKLPLSRTQGTGGSPVKLRDDV